MTLRIGTFNAQFLPHLPSNTRRAAVLAERIRGAEYDLLVLTEVFSGRARRVLLERLADAYPWNVQYIGSRRIVREDSGLMLLSRLPFEPLPTSPYAAHPRIRASASGHAPDWPHVWFVEYRGCASSDCLAGKGAGYVRLRFADRPLNVFFTHMQAAYDYHGPRRHARTRRIRRAQLHQMADMIRAALTDGRAAEENTVILGDLNVDGVRSGNGSLAHGEEWKEMLATLHQLFPGGASDVWDRHAPVTDAGHTFPAWQPNARRDYVILSAADQQSPLQVQHVSLDHDLARPEGTANHLSDHVGISVDLNLPQSGCHPLDAHAVAGVDSVEIDGRIDHPGGLQWYAVTTGETTTVDVGLRAAGTGMRPVVYRADDISRPLTPAAPTDNATARYELNGSHFIRVGEPRSTVSGAYSLQVKSVV